ncbi:MAG: putative transport system permease protein [Thermotogaceae bacterium]|nr:putative transport system permease protein [Thermotogaceae bacterium]
MSFFITIIVTLLVFVFIILISNKKVRKISFRNLFRKKTQTILIILGSMIGTAMITGSLGINDSMSLFLYSQIRNDLGPIDEIIYKGNQDQFLTFKKQLGDEFCQDAQSNLFIDGCLNAYYMNGTLSFNNTRIKNPLTDISVKIIAFDFSNLNFFDIKNKNTSKFIISQSLKEKIASVGTGEFYLSEQTNSLFDIGKSKFKIEEYLTTDNIPRLNVITPNFEGNYTVFIDIKEFYQIFPEKENDINVIMISNTGDWLKGNTMTTNVISFFENSDLSRLGYKMEAVKLESLQQVGNANIGYLFLFLSVFSIVSGIFLMISTYSMMAKEREIEIGMLRAIGYSETDIGRMFFLEGIFYSVLSTSLGIFSGIFLTKYILSSITGFVFKVSNRFLNTIGSTILSMNEIPEFEFYISNQNIIVSFSIGIFISLIIIFFYSKRISKIGIVNAIRGTDSYITAKHKQKIFVRVLLIVISIFIVFNGIQNKDLLFSSLGFIIFIFGLLLNQLSKKKLLFNLLLISLIFITFFLEADVFSNTEYAFFIIMMKPFILLISLPILLLSNLEVLRRLFFNKAFSKILDPFITKIAFAYPKKEKGKTGLIVAIYALVLFIIVIVTVIPHSQMIGIKKSSETLFWGYDAFVPDFLNTNKDYKEELKNKAFIQNIQEITEFSMKTTTGMQRAFLIPQKFSFPDPQGKWYPTSEYKTLETAIEHLKENKSAYIVISGRESETVDTGSKQIQLSDKFEKLGTYFFDNITFFQGILLTDEKQIQSEDFNQYDLIKISGNTDEEISRNKEEFRGFSEKNGLFAITNDDVVEISEIAIQGMIKILNGFLYFGMIIGIMGISITMYRAFYDRKKTIGMLKAIGFTKRQIFFSFITETTIIVVIGLFIGIASGIISGEQINTIFSQLGAPGGETLYIPWAKLIIISVSFYIASIISVLIPSYNASKINPAEALKTLE